MRNLSYSLFLFICLFMACNKSNVVEDPEVKNTVPVEDIMAIAEMTNDFGWKLFQEVTTGVTNENVLISPLSVQTALSMAVNGANGTTLEEMLNVLGCAGCNVKDLNTQTAQLRTQMEEQSGHPRLISANGFFYDPNRVYVLESFIQTLSNDYRTGFQAYNFGDPGSIEKINIWVKENTDGKIEKIVDEIGENDIAFLINALHFKADWATGFHQGFTYSNMFTTAERTEVPVEYVSGDRNFSTAQGQSFRMVELPFKDTTYSLTLVQPLGTVGDQPDWILLLKSSDLIDMWNNLSYGRAIVSFPKLDIEYDEELKNPLMRMGITEAFSQWNADFSNLGHALKGPIIYISKVRHKAVLKVDEKGAEGAAVTSINFSYTSFPPQFTFDKPFVIVLRHMPTNAILFAGLINDPS